MITAQRAPRRLPRPLSKVLLLTCLELEDAQVTVGKLSTSACRWCQQREPSELSEPSNIDSDQRRRNTSFRKITQYTDTYRTVCPWAVEVDLNEVGR